MKLQNYIAGEPIMQFWSNAKHPFHNLSNFALILDGIKFDGIIYPTTEHVFQAQKYIKEQRYRFSVTGDLGLWEGLKLVYKPEEFDKKYKYWSKKSNLGIIAKMATNKKNGIRLGLIRDENFTSTDELWIEIF